MINIVYSLISFIGIISSLFLLSHNHNNISRLALLILTFLLSAFQFLIFDYYFLGLTYIIVYVGAIAILFLFVIMLIQTDQNSIISFSNNYSFIIFSFFSLLLFFFSFFLDHSSIYSFFLPSWSFDLFTLTDIQSLGFSIFLAYPLTLIILGILLWIVLIGILCICSF